MAKAPSDDRWTEADLIALEPHEHDFQEFKGSRFLVDTLGDIRADFVELLSKQVSAFANGAGGHLFIGLDDSGLIDGGVPVALKGGGTRAWLEDLVPGCVDPNLMSCNVYEVPHSAPSSRVLPEHAVYVVEIPSSEEAPHQAKDHRYYLRIAGKSRPMGHVHVQDVLRRTRHPAITLTRLGPYGDAEYDSGDPRGPRAFIQFRAFLMNIGRTMARHVGLELHVPRPFAGKAVRDRMRQAAETHRSQSPGQLAYFRYHPTPLFPTQEVYGASVWICLHASNVGLVHSGASLEWVLYADDAAPTFGGTPLNRFTVVNRAVAWLTQTD